jgi:hypothetical protein
LIITCRQEATHGLIETSLDVGYGDWSGLASREVVEVRRPIE